MSTHPITARTPLADAILTLPTNVANFHALPISSSATIELDPELATIYSCLFGSHLQAEASYSSPAIDSFFHPTGPLLEAQQLAAKAFDVDATFFGSCGTTLSNLAALDGAIRPGGKILLDRTAHQSLHIAAHTTKSDVDYAPIIPNYLHTNLPSLDIEATISLLKESSKNSQPYDVVAISVSSYEGLTYCMSEVLERIYEASPTTTVITDEAWGAINTFIPSLRKYSTIEAALNLRSKGADPQVIVTQSAHKTLAALRQASMIHVLGSTKLIDSIQSSLRAYHTTSPSWPILASIDLSRAHACRNAPHAYQKLSIAKLKLLDSIDNLDHFHVERSSEKIPKFMARDPLKFRIEFDSSIESSRLRSTLFYNYGVYVSRANSNSFLIHMHMGNLGQEDRLLTALSNLDMKSGSQPPSNSLNPKGGLVVAYPPGIPLLTPNETWDQIHHEVLKSCLSQDLDIYHLSV